MPLVIYTGIHAMTREPELQLPAGTQMLTLEALKAESPAAAPQPEHSDEAEKTEENQQALLLESLSENVLEGVSQWLKQDATNKAIIVWPRPVAYIAAQLAAGKQSDEALEDWQQLATALLKLFRSHRRHLKLVAAEPGGESPAMDDMTLATLPVPEHSPIYTLAAKQLVDASETLTQTATRLFTSSELAYKTSEALTDQVNGALLHHQQHVQQTANLQQNLEQLKHQQAEQQAASKKQLDELTKQRDNLRQEQTQQHAASIKQLDELTKQRDNLRQEQAQQHAASKKQLDELIKQRDNLKQEKEQQLSALQEENDMVITELHRVQEALEKALNERSAANKKAEELAKVKPLYENAEKQLKALQQQSQADKDARVKVQKALDESQAKLAEHQKIVVNLKDEKQRLGGELKVTQSALEKTNKEVITHKESWQKEQQAHQQALALSNERKKQLEQQKAELSSAKEENDMVIAELHRVQEALEKALNERSAANKKAEELAKVKPLYENAEKQLKTLQQQSQAEKDARVKVQKALDESQAKLVEHQKNIAKLKEDNQRLVGELKVNRSALEKTNKEVITHKESWQKEQQAHQQALALSNERKKQLEQQKAELSSAKEENDMVIAELHRVQEALEKTLNERNAANKKAEELAKLKPLHESTEKELKALKQQNQSEKDAHAQTQKKLEATQTSMAGLQEENAMVIAELHRVQELLESKLYERDELIKQRDNVIHERNIAAHQRESALQQLDHRLAQLQQLHTDKKAQQLDQEALKQRLERTQKQLNVLKSEFQQALHERDAWNQWLKSHAYRFITATYRHSRAYRKTLRQQSSLVNASSYFDAHWYQEQYPDLAEAKANPAEHYLKFGALEGRNPSPHFNTEFYITQYPDVATAGDNPLIHFLRYGQMERRKTNYEQLQLPSPQSSGQEVTDASSQATQDKEAR